MKKILSILTAFIVAFNISYHTNALAEANEGYIQSAIVKVEVADNHILILKSDGSVWAKGKNEGGLLGCGVGDVYIQELAQVLALENIVDISSRGDYSLALDDDGDVWAWGANGHGQLGTGDYADRTTPVKILGTGNIEKIYAGWLHSAAITENGSVYTWGQNESGQLGEGMPSRNPNPSLVSSISNVEDIAIGYRHTLFLADGCVYASGSNTYGQLGLGNNTARSAPTKINNYTDVTDIDCGKEFSVMINNGKVYAWGRNNCGQLGDETKTNRTSPTFSNLQYADDIECGTDYVLAHTNYIGKRTWYGWGNNTYGQFGNGIGRGIVWDEKLISSPEITAFYVSAGEHCTAFMQGGKMWFSGMNVNGEISPRTILYNLPVSQEIVPNIDNMYGIENETYLVSDDVVYTFGGNGERLSQHSYMSSSGIRFHTEWYYDTVKYLKDCEYNFEVRLDNNGDVWARGSNRYGQMGNNMWIYQNEYMPVDNNVMPNIIDIETAGGAVYAIDENGELWTWGNNSNGQALRGDSLTYDSPAKTDYTGVSKVCFVDKTPHVIYSGRTDNVIDIAYFKRYITNADVSPYYQTDEIKLLSTGQIETDLYDLSDVTDAVQISASGEHLLVLKNDGTVWSIGKNNYGQLGTGDYIDRDVLTQVPGLTNVMFIYAGKNHSVAYTQQGHIYVWGNNAYGQLGLGFANLYYPHPEKYTYNSVVVEDAAFNAGDALYLRINIENIYPWIEEDPPYELIYDPDKLEVDCMYVNGVEKPITVGVHDSVEIVAAYEGRILFKIKSLPTYDGIYTSTLGFIKFHALTDGTDEIKLVSQK